MKYINDLTPIINGVCKAAEIITSTMGAEGKTVAIYDNEQLRFTKDGVTVARNIQFDDPFENIGAKILISAANETVRNVGDGPQPLYSKVLTPNGFVTMGSLNKEDLIIGTNHTIQKVVDIFPKGQKEIYKVHFMDGRIVECCIDHLWKVYYKGVSKVMSLKEIIDSNKLLTVKSCGTKEYGYYVQKPFVDFPNKKTIIDPYLLGLLIGDGSLSETGQIELSLGLNKEHIIDKIPKEFIRSCKFYENKNYFRVKLKGLKESLQTLGLYGTTSKTKFIPKDYLYNSKVNRSLLLKGLLDTDGHINKRNRFEYSTVSNQLSDDFLELVRGLNYSVNYKLLTNRGKAAYSDTPIHRINQLKGYLNGNKIVEIEKTGNFTEMQCILVSNPDHLYITDNYIVTHNTTLTSLFLKELITSINISSDNVNDTLNEVEKDINLVIEELNNYITKTTTTEQINNIATISSNSKVIGKLFEDLYKEASFDSLIKLENSEYSNQSYFEVLKGIQFDSGFAHPAFMTDKDVEQCVFENATIHLDREKITTVTEDYKNLLGVANKQNIPLIIMAPSFSDAFVRMCTMNKVNAGVQICLVKTPGSSTHAQNKNYEDIKSFLSSEGFVDKVIVNAYNITLFNEDTPFLNDRINTLRKLKDSAVEWWEEEDYKQRIHKMKGSSAIIYAAGRTKEAQSEEYDRIEDAIGATQSAIKYGYVIGGGYTSYMLNPKTDILKRVLKSPLYTILDNADIDIKTSRLKTMLNDGHVMNVKTKEWESITDTNIFDPAQVIVQALENAFSNTRLIVNTSYTINK